MKPVYHSFIFVSNESLHTEFTISSDNLQIQFINWLQLQEVESLNYYGEYNTIRLFLRSKSGVNAQYHEKQFATIESTLAPVFNKYLKTDAQNKFG